MRTDLPHRHVPELPRIARVDVLGRKKPRRSVSWVQLAKETAGQPRAVRSKPQMISDPQRAMIARNRTKLPPGTSIVEGVQLRAIVRTTAAGRVPLRIGLWRLHTALGASMR